MEQPSLTGRVLGGRYTLGERLGVGGWGAVYSAVQNDLGRKVAIKVLHMNVAVTTDGLARFEREAKAAAAFGHPNIAQVTDFQANADEPPFLVMELLTGGTLGTVLRREKKLPQARLAWIAHQILSGLDVAHGAGIIHRDIKPDNVFLVSMPGVDDLVKILDFGIAKLTSEGQQQLTESGSMLGSPAFMAPEQIRTRDVDHRVDIYALGATMYFALAGRLAFEAPNVHGMLLAITEQRATPLSILDPTIDPRMSALVERAMHKDPSARFASAAEMRAALEPFVSGRLGQTAAAGSWQGSPMISPASMATNGAPMTVANPPTFGPSAAYAHSPMPMSPPPGSPPPGSAPPGSAPPGSPPAGHPAGAPMGPPPMGPPPPMMMAPMAHAATPPPAPAKGSPVVGLLVAIIGLLVLLIAGGAGAFLFYSRSGSEHDGSAGAVASADPKAPAPAGAAPAATASSTQPAAVAGAATAGAAAGTTGAASKPGVAPATPAKAGAVAAVAPGTPLAAGASTGQAPATAGAGAGAGAVAAPTASAATGPKQFAGTRWSIGGGSFGTFEIAPAKAAIMTMSGAIQACFNATEFDPPDHQFTNWTLQVAPTGSVTSVRRTTDFQPHPKFDVCMIGALRQVKFAASPAGGPIQVGFTARTRDNP